MPRTEDLKQSNLPSCIGCPALMLPRTMSDSLEDVIIPQAWLYIHDFQQSSCCKESHFPAGVCTPRGLSLCLCVISSPVYLTSRVRQLPGNTTAAATTCRETHRNVFSGGRHRMLVCHLASNALDYFSLVYLITTVTVVLLVYVIHQSKCK